ncbi:hypothetical protein IAD21_02655 [Abditibacteriota bacterium]|nr:hypothetical protein IAD21_02655 [Abditibacteriota bacterium]
MSPKIPIALSFISVGLLLIGLNIPLLQGKIKRNPYYGVRIRKSFESEENWLKINRYGAKQMIVWSAVMVALGIATFFVPFNNATYLAIIFGSVVLFCVLVPSVQIILYTKKL